MSETNKRTGKREEMRRSSMDLTAVPERGGGGSFTEMLAKNVSNLGKYTALMICKSKS